MDGQSQDGQKALQSEVQLQESWLSLPVTSLQIEHQGRPDHSISHVLQPHWADPVLDPSEMGVSNLKHAHRRVITPWAMI